MSQVIKIKQSAVPGKVPQVSDLALGELALNTFDGKLYAIQNTGTPTVIELTGGGSGSSDEVQVAFSFSDSSVIPITVAPANKIILEVQLALVTPFDNIGATLSVGDSVNMEQLVATEDNDPTIETTFAFHPLFVYGVDTQVYLFITAAGSTQGQGLVTIKFQQ